MKIKQHYLDALHGMIAQKDKPFKSLDAFDKQCIEELIAILNSPTVMFQNINNVLNRYIDKNGCDNGSMINIMVNIQRDIYMKMMMSGDIVGLNGILRALNERLAKYYQSSHEIELIDFPVVLREKELR